jgi:transposase
VPEVVVFRDDFGRGLHRHQRHHRDLPSYSKERRIDPQIVVGLLVDRTGFPLEVGCFEGNTTETNTLLPIITAFQARHDLTDTPMVIAADAGMLSASNLSALDEAGLGFIRRLAQREGADRSRVPFPLER